MRPGLSWALVLAALCARPLRAQNQWVPIVASPITTYSVDLISIVHPTPTTITIMVKSEFKPGNALLALGIASSVQHEAIDCARKQVRILTMQQYNSDGDSIGKQANGQNRWSKPRKGSDYETVISEICDRFWSAP